MVCCQHGLQPSNSWGWLCKSLPFLFHKLRLKISARVTEALTIYCWTFRREFSPFTNRRFFLYAVLNLWCYCVERNWPGIWSSSKAKSELNYSLIGNVWADKLIFIFFFSGGGESIKEEESLCSGTNLRTTSCYLAFVCKENVGRKALALENTRIEFVSILLSSLRLFSDLFLLLNN